MPARPRASLLQIVAVGFVVLASMRTLVLLDDLTQPGAPTTPDGAAAPMAEAFEPLEPGAGPDDQAQATDPLVSKPVPDDALEGPGLWIEGVTVTCEPRLLEAIKERRHQLEARAAELDQRARMLEAIEKRATEQVRALEEQRKALETVLTSSQEVAEDEIKRLVAIYENMNPKEAAPIFEAMPPEVAAGFIRRMRATKSAPIMGRLNARHAYAISLALASNGTPARDR
ncbi:MAG: MotE family protein [Geminicoccaceae bacterium]